MAEVQAISAPKTEPVKTSVEKNLLPEKKNSDPKLCIQPKLTVGAPDDPYEKEADAVADQVMRMPEKGAVQRKKGSEDEEGLQLKSDDSIIHRKCAGCEKEELVQTHLKDKTIQRRLQVSDDNPPGMPPNDIGDTMSHADKISHFTSIIQSLCPSFTTNNNGFVIPTSNPPAGPAALSTGAHPLGCCGINILANSPNHLWKIETSQLLGAKTVFNDFLFVLPPPNSAISFGDFTSTDRRADINDVVVAGHEMIGHGAQHELGIHNQGDEDRESFNHHDPTVRIQNLVAHEQGISAVDDRGLAAPGIHRGESFAKIEIKGFAFNSTSTSSLPQAEQDKIRLIANFIRTNKMWVDIIGHSDPIGSPAAKQFVSNNRAEAVKRKLVQLGVTPLFSKSLPTYQYNNRRRFTRVAGVSDTQPPLTGASNNANWRRVEIFAVNHPAGAEVPPSDIPNLHQATPGANLATELVSTDSCHRLLANSAFPQPPVVQPKLFAGSQNDALENEADHVADKVMRMDNPKSIQRDENNGISVDPLIDPLQLQLPGWDQLQVNNELNFRGVPRTPGLLDDISLQFPEMVEFNRRFYLGNIVKNLNNVRGLKLIIPDLEGDPNVALANKLLPTFVGNALNREYQSQAEQSGATIFPLFNISHDIGGGPRRKCAECEKEDEEKLHRKANTDKSFLQTKTEKNTPSVSDSFSQSIESSKGNGSSMDESTRSFMSERFGADFSTVKIHTNSDSAQMNRQLNAKAFTTGSDIYFNEGQYQPHSAEGKTLLAHELAHTIQQNGSIQPKLIQRKPSKKDQKADNPKIKYGEIIPLNQLNWKEFGFNHVNPFKHKGYAPFETPNAFANETYKIQEAILKIAPAADLKKFPLTANGIFGKATIDYLVDFAVDAQTDKDSKALFISYGIDSEILDLFNKVAEKNVQPEPLLSEDFKQHPLFYLININKTFLLATGDENDAVKILQQVLIRLNYNIGNKGPDGVFGEDTARALKAYQREAGLPKWEADGMLGYKTLRLLDKRMSVASKDFMFSTPGGNIISFKVPVSRIMTKDEKLLHAVMHIFQVSEKQAMELINTKDEENKWGWLKDGFKETTEADLNRGYEYIGVPVKDYETIVTIFKSKHPGVGEPLEPRLKAARTDIEPYSKIYQLTKEIEELKSKKLKSTVLNIATGVGGLTAASYDALIKVKEKEKADELAKLGITEDIYKTKTREFQRLFASYAVKVAFQMLDDNEREASIEMIKFKKSSDPDALDQGKELKAAFTHLNDVWSRAEKEWWQGISIAQGAGADEIYSYSTLNAYLKEKKGQRKHCFKGECTEPADNVLPAYENIKFKKREGNPYFIKAFDSNAEAFEYLRLKAETYPVLAYPKLELKNNISKFKDLSEEQIEAKLFATGENVKANIIKTRQALDESPMNVFKLKPVINMAKFQLGIFPDTIHDNLVNDAIKEYEDAEFWKNIGLAALGIGLGLLALVSGPVGWAALAAGIAVGSVDAYFQYQDITFMRTAANTAFDPLKALSDVEPGYFWFYVSLVFIGLDVFQGLKTIAAVAKAAKATEEGTELAGKLIAALKKDKDELLELIKQGGDDVAKLTEQLKKLDAAISAVDAEKLAKQINVLKNLHDLPQAVIRLSSSLENAEVLAAFEKLASLMKKSGLTDDAYKSVLKFYAGTGNDLAAELPEFIRLAEKTDWAAKPGLLQELLSNPRSQKVMLDVGENQDKIIKLWDEFKVLKDAGHATTFTDFLKGKGFATELGKTKPLAEQLGVSFSKLPTLTKNQQILRTIEPALADALLDKALPKRIEEALTRILETDIIGHSTDLVRAQERMKNSLRLLGATLETPAEYQQVMRLLKSTESKMAVFEKATSLAGHEEYVALMTKYSKELAADSKALDDFLRIGPFTDDDTFKWLLSKPSIRKLIADNPELVKALKKCASPCFPIHAEIGDIEKILNAIKNNKGKVDYSRLNQYMYLNRPRNSTVAELEKWKKAVDNLAGDFEGTIKGVNMPKGSEISLPPNFKATGITPLKDAAKKLDILISRGFSPKQLEDILVQAHINKLEPNEFMEQLSLATNKLGSRPLDNISGIINGLSSTNPQKFETAYHFMRRIGAYTKSTAGVEMAERVFAVFDINEITKLRYSSASKLSAEAAKETGEVSIASLEMFNTLASKIDGSSEEIIRLARKAGTGTEENLARLTSVAEKMPPGKHSIASIEAKITEAKELAKKIAAAGDNMGDEIWGVTKTGDKWKVGSKFTDETGKISGSKAIAHIKGKADEIAEALLDSTGAVSQSQWAIFRKSIENTDLPQVIKNGIIGEMWGKTNVAAYKKVFGSKNVFEQVTIRIKGTNIEAVVDAVIKKDGQVLFKEFKSGSATLSTGQEKVYEKMALGLTDELEFAGEKAAQVWPDPKTFSVSKVEIVTEPVTP